MSRRPSAVQRSQGIPEATIARLPVYLRVLYACAEQGIATVSSEELAAAAGVNSAKLRKDLSHLGSYGTRGGGYDVDPGVVGTEIAGHVVEGADQIEPVITRHQVSIGVIATPAGAAQGVCDRLVAAGVTSILNFAPVVLTVPVGVDVRKVDLSIELQILAFHAQRRSVVRVAPDGKRYHQGRVMPADGRSAVAGGVVGESAVAAP